MKKRYALGMLLVLAAVAAWRPLARAGEEVAEPKALKAQTKCPIMGGPINKDLFADVAGHRIYVCCQGCVAKVKEDPQKALATLKAAGEKAEVRLCKVCPASGEGLQCPVLDALECKEPCSAKGCSKLQTTEEAKAIAQCTRAPCPVKRSTEEAAKCAKASTLAQGSPECTKASAASCPLKGTASCPLTGDAAKAGCAKEDAACDQAKASAGCCAKTAEASSCPVAGACPN